MSDIGYIQHAREELRGLMMPAYVFATKQIFSAFNNAEFEMFDG